MFSLITGIKNHISFFKLFFGKKPKGMVPLAVPDARKLHAKYTEAQKWILNENLVFNIHVPDITHYR